MASEPESLILQYLRRLDTTVQAMREDIAERKHRMTGVEEGLAGVNRRLDRLDGRMERVERRLELTET